MPHEEREQKSAGETALERLIDEAFLLAQAGNMPSAIAQMEAACTCNAARSATYEMLAQFLLEGDRPFDALHAAQNALELDDQVEPSLSAPVIQILSPTGAEHPMCNCSGRKHTSPLPGRTWSA